MSRLVGVVLGWGWLVLRRGGVDWCRVGVELAGVV